MQYIKFEQLNKETLYNAINQSRYTTETMLPNIIPIGKMKGSNGMIRGFKMYDINTDKTSVKTFGQIMDMMLSGIKVAGIEIVSRFSCDDTLEPVISSVSLAFNKGFYNMARMSSVDEDGKQLDNGFLTLIGTDTTKDELKFILMDASGNTSKVDFRQLLMSCALGIEMAKGRIALANLQPYE